MPQPDLWGTCRKLIEIYGSDAVATAASRAERLISQGDEKGAWRWREIAGVVQQLLERRKTGQL